MALFNECRQSCAHIVLDTADIVRDGDLATTILECASVTELQERISGIFCLAWCICGGTVGA